MTKLVHYFVKFYNKCNRLDILLMFYTPLSKRGFGSGGRTMDNVTWLSLLRYIVFVNPPFSSNGNHLLILLFI